MEKELPPALEACF